MTTVISVENLSKTYRLGQIGTGTFTNDLKVWWAKARGKSNPLLRIGETDHGNRDGENLWALRDVSFKVEQGEVLGIIGRNGAGKSTLLKILSRVTAPTSGQIKVKGRVASLLEVGTGFHPELTGRENIYLNGSILGMSRNEISRKFDEIVDFSEVEKFIDTPVKRYSSGMHVRLAFAVAAHLDPEILVVDEVLAVGDAAFQKKCLGKMGDVAREGRTVLFVSHNMDAVVALTRKCLWLTHGEILRMGETTDVVESYMAQIMQNQVSDGWLDLRDTERKKDSELIRFVWIKIHDGNGEQKNIFYEGEPIILEIGMQVKKEIENLQFGCSVKDAKIDHPLFTIASQITKTKLFPGVFSAKVRIDPNPLRKGIYSFVLKAFVNDVRHDNIKPEFQLSVISSGKNQWIQKWITGSLSLDYSWSDLQEANNFSKR